MGAVDARRRTQRFSVLVAGWTAHRVSVEPLRLDADLDDAGRWHRAETVDDIR